MSSASASCSPHDHQVVVQPEPAEREHWDCSLERMMQSSRDANPETDLYHLSTVSPRVRQKGCASW